LRVGETSNFADLKHQTNGQFLVSLPQNSQSGVYFKWTVPSTH